MRRIAFTLALAGFLHGTALSAQLTVRPPTVEQQSCSPTAESADGKSKARDPQSQQLLLPPLDGTPREMRGKEMTLRFLINTSGTVDSVDATDARRHINDPKFEATLIKAFKVYRWNPGVNKEGCKVRMWATMKITFA